VEKCEFTKAAKEGTSLKVYFGGCEYPKALTQLHELGIKTVMFSYAAKPSTNVWNLVEEFGMEVLLDSGAFSAWSRGEIISIDDYANCLTKRQPAKYFNLDVIGDPEATRENQKYLESRGFNPIPVFHLGEPMELLDELVQDYEIVGLGGSVGKSFKVRNGWLDQVYSRHPNGSFHGLGITHRGLMVEYPFDSVDSTWWLAKFKTKSPRVSMDQGVEREYRIKHLLSMTGNPERNDLVG